VRSGGMKVWRVVTCRRKRSGEESEKQSRWDVRVWRICFWGLFWSILGEYFGECGEVVFI